MRPLHNASGTADGAYGHHQDKPIILLPGPPKECLPMFKTQALTWLQQHPWQKRPPRSSWLLMGIGESSVAEIIESIPLDSASQIGYRAHYPYVEVKLFSYHTQLYEAELQKKLQPWLCDYSPNSYFSQWSTWMSNNLDKTQVHIQGQSPDFIDWLAPWVFKQQVSLTSQATQADIFLIITPQKQLLTLKASRYNLEESLSFNSPHLWHQKKITQESLCRFWLKLSKQLS